MASLAASTSHSRERRSSGRRFGGSWSWAALPVGLATVLFALPLVYLVWEMAALGPARAADLLFRPFVGGLLVNTLVLAASVTLGSVIVGVGAAWLVEGSDLPGRALWRVLVPLPLAIPALVSAFAWLSLTPRVEGMGGAIVVLILAEYPLIYMPVAAALRGLDPAFEEVARSLGHGPRRILASTVLPQLLPAIGAGALLVCLHMLVEFGPLALLRVETFTTAIYEAYELAYDGAAAALLSGVLALLCVIVLVVGARLRGARRFAHVGAGAARPRRPLPLGALRWPAVVLLATLLVLALGVPTGMLAWWIARAQGTTVTLAAIVQSTLDSMRLSGLGALVTTLAALVLALASLRNPGRAGRLAERLPLVVHALPGLVVALSLVFVSLHLFPLAYQTTALLMLAYALRFLPLAQAGLRPALAQVPPAMEEVARACGRPPWRVAIEVTLPNILPGLGAAALLVFLQLMKELTATLVLAPTGTKTLAMQLWAQSAQMKYASAAPYAVLLVLVSGLPAYLATATWLARRTRP